MSDPKPTDVDHFEVIVEAVRVDGIRIRMTMHQQHIQPRCAFCNRPVVDADGQIRATLFSTQAGFGLRCELPKGCP